MPRKYTPKTDKRHSEEHKAKIAAKLREKYSDPEARAETSAKMKAYHARAQAAMALLAEQEADRG